MNHYREIEGLPISMISERTKFTSTNTPVNPNQEFKHKKTGTTTVGVVGNGFVLLAADQQATMGNVVADEDAQKIYAITDYVALTISGGVGDALAIIRFLKAQAALYEVERGVKITPKAVASLLSNVLNGNRYYPFMFMPLIGGVNNKAELYEIDPVGSIADKKRYGVTGSGSDFAISILDADFKEAMNEDEALLLAVRAVMASKNRDIYTGGKTISAVIIDSQGYRQLDAKDVEKTISKVKINFAKPQKM
ncbi:MAG: proteasome subunit beta [archaeon]|jgi:proteasome beta subunit